MADKHADFDPYRKWLGIPSNQRPITFYLLLGLAPTETDAEVIEDAATRQSSHLRTYLAGEHAADCQRLLDEIAQARLVLLHPEKRAAYDAKLNAAKPKSKPAAATVLESADPFGSSVFAAPSRSPEPRAKPRKHPQGVNTGLVLGLGAGAVVVLAALVGVAVWRSRPDPAPPPGPAARKGDPPIERPRPVSIAKAEKKAPKVDEPVQVEPVKDLEPPKTTEPAKTEAPVEKKAEGVTVAEREWRKGMPRETRLMGMDDGIALFGGVAGTFYGWGERILIAPLGGNDWTFEAFATPHLQGYANCVTGLPAGLLDVPNATLTESWQDGGGVRSVRKVLCAEGDGICWLAGLCGHLGGGEGVRIFREAGNWSMEVKSGGSDVAGWGVACPFGKDVDRSNLRMIEVLARPRVGAIKLLDARDGFCAFLEISGRIQGDRRDVKLHVKQGAWWLAVRDSEVERPELTIRVLCVSLTGKLPTISETDATVDSIELPKIDVLASKRPWEDRRPVPDAETLAARQKALRVTIKAPAPGANDEEQRKHLEIMLAAGLDTSDDPAMRYALLNEVFERTYPLGDSKMAQRALAALTRDFVVDAGELRSAALAKTSAKPLSPASSLVLARVSDAFVADALKGDDLDRAEKIAGVGMMAGQQTKILAEASASMKRLLQVRTLAKSYQAYKAAETILATTPDDPKACADAGQYLALVQGKWDEGLKLLARGSDAKLKALAASDLAEPTDSEARQALGDAWADLADRSQGEIKTQAAWRACRWYALVVGEINGLRRTKLDKRMSVIEKIIPMPASLPAARWTFDVDARDVLGNMHGTVPTQTIFAHGAMRLLKGERMTALLPFDVRERTLEIWCRLKHNRHRSDPFMTLGETERSRRTLDGKWDGIICSPTIHDRPYPGSDYQHRSRELDTDQEFGRTNETMHLAAVYAKDNTVTLYANGAMLGQPFLPAPRDADHDLVTYRKGAASLILGGTMTIEVDEARLYTRALTAGEIASSYRTFKY